MARLGPLFDPPSPTEKSLWVPFCFLSQEMRQIIFWGPKILPRNRKPRNSKLLPKKRLPEIPFRYPPPGTQKMQKSYFGGIFRGKLFLLTVGAFLLTVKFFVYSPLRPLSEALPTVSKKAPIVSKKAKAVSKKTPIASKKAKIVNCK